MMVLRNCLIPIVLFSATPAFASSVIFQDGTFNNITVGAQYNSDSANTTSSAGQCSTCGAGSTQGLGLTANFNANAMGNPNNSANTLPQTTFAIIENSFTYNPTTQGGITSIDASVAKNFSSTENAMGIGNTFRPVIEQDGNFYLASIAGPLLNGPGTTGYSVLSGSDLTASDFTLFNFTTGVFGSGNPNFDGDPITFGLAQNFNLQAGTNNTADYDNLQLEINPTPIPATLPLFAGGLGFVGYLTRRKKRVQTVAAA